MATLSEPQIRDRSQSQGCDPPSENNALKKRHTIGDVGTALVHVLRIAKGQTNEDTMDTNLSPKEGVSFKNLRRPSESVDAKSDKTNTSAFAAALQRRRSTFKNIACGITNMMRLRSLSTGKVEPLKPKIRYENSYRLGPDSGKHIAISETEKVAAQVLEDLIGDRKYDHIICGRLSLEITNLIKEKIKALNFPRYRIVVQVVISQANGQGLEAASRCLWDSKVDNYSCVTYRNDTIIAMALIYGVYLE